MEAKFCGAIVCLFCIIASVYTLEAVNGKIKIEVVTTSACGDTVRFINLQLLDAYNEYRNFLEVKFVPWGRTVRNETGIYCQFGVNDCWANRVHRCALHLLENDQDRQLDYMVCEFSSPYPAWSGNYQCAIQVGLSLVHLDYCMTTTGDILEDIAEEASREPMRILDFVPAIVFNDDIDIYLHREAQLRLKSMICFALAEDPDTGITNCLI